MAGAGAACAEFFNPKSCSFALKKKIVKNMLAWSHYAFRQNAQEHGQARPSHHLLQPYSQKKKYARYPAEYVQFGGILRSVNNFVESPMDALSNDVRIKMSHIVTSTLTFVVKTMSKQTLHKTHITQHLTHNFCVV